MRVDGLDEVASAISQAQRICACGHVNPDGDCLGSVAAFARVAAAMGKRAIPLFAEEESSTSLAGAVPGFELFKTPSQVAADGFDLFVAIDVPNPERLGDAKGLFYGAPSKIIIDHHPDTLDEADLVYSDASAAAAGIIIWELAEAAGVQPDAQTASACYVALLTDTGRFQYQNTDSRCFEVAARLIGAGANPGAIASAVYQNRSIAALRLQSRLIERLTTSDDGKVAYSWISEEDIRELEATKDDTETLSEVLRSLRGVCVAALLREQDGKVRGSLRAKGAEDVGSVARALGGGGHKAAAGFTFDGTVEECLAKLKPLLEGGVGGP